MKLSTMNEIFSKINSMECGLKTLRNQELESDKEISDKLSSLEFSFAEFVAQFKGLITISEIEYTR